MQLHTLRSYPAVIPPQELPTVTCPNTHNLNTKLLCVVLFIVLQQERGPLLMSPNQTIGSRQEKISVHFPRQLQQCAKNLTVDERKLRGSPVFIVVERRTNGFLQVIKRQIFAEG